MKIEPLLGALIGFRPASASSARAKVSVPPLTGSPSAVPEVSPLADVSPVESLLLSQAATKTIRTSSTAVAKARAPHPRLNHELSLTDRMKVLLGGLDNPCLCIQ